MLLYEVKEKPMKSKRQATMTGCALPTEKDIAWMKNSMQRHTGGFDAWWKENKDLVSGEDWIKVIVTIWEAGRAKKCVG